ncbi:MAG: hypothetical protein KAS29_05500, partial [Bacteroidales bacterium]|nr:hypothetical protein [Bacteroidales bacterium]
VVSFYGSKWELYNLADDRCEQHDLSGEYPQLADELSERWYEMAEITNMLPEEARKPVKNVPASNTHREWHKPQLTEGWRPF